MVSERQEAKRAASNQEEDDPELSSALENAHNHQLSLRKEENRHTETMSKLNLGRVGDWVGNGASVPTLAALATVALSFLVAIGLYVAMAYQPEYGELYSQNAERSLSVALAALAYVFGKGGK